MLSDRSQIQKTCIGSFHLKEMFRISKSIETEEDFWLSRAESYEEKIGSVC